MFDAILYIYENLFQPIIQAIINGFGNITDALHLTNDIFVQPLTITLFSDTPIVVTSLGDILMVILIALFSIWFAKFIVYILKVPFKFFARLGR